MAILKINGVAIHDPSSLEWALQDLDSEDGAGRNQSGTMFRDRIAIKRKVSCQWPPMTPSEMSKILKAMDSVFFTLTYPDAHDGAERTGEFYVGDRTAPMYMWSEEKQKYLWEGLSADFIER